ncbi:MAG TPA: PAS domain S-box protein, partial [Rhodospirillales bacterium]|nr:PAS domain S-box protein [Rhodospirillales bacterium]
MSKDSPANDDDAGGQNNSGEMKSSVLDSYSDAALVVRGDMTVAAANDKGQVLKALLDQGEIGEIPKMIAEAGASMQVGTGSVVLSGSKGDIYMDLTVVPLAAAGGETDTTYMVLSHDNTMERNLRSALVESRQRYKDLVEVSSDFSWEVNEDGTFSFVSPGGVLGFTPEQLIDHRPQDFVLNAEDYNPLLFLSDRNERNVEIWMRTSRGNSACVVGSSRPLTDNNGKWMGARGICRDITLEREREAALRSAREREQLLNRIVKSIRDEVSPLNMLNNAAATTSQALGASGCHIYRNDAEEGLVLAAEYGELVEPEEAQKYLKELNVDSSTVSVVAEPWRVLVTPTNYRQQLNGAICIWKPLDDNDWDANYFILLGDVANQIGIANEQSANHERIVNLSRTDGMTGLLNRRAFFEDELPRRFTRLEQDGQGAALFYLDMDNFKLVNDIHGHQRG